VVAVGLQYVCLLTRLATNAASKFYCLEQFELSDLNGLLVSKYEYNSVLLLVSNRIPFIKRLPYSICSQRTVLFRRVPFVRAQLQLPH